MFTWIAAPVRDRRSRRCPRTCGRFFVAEYQALLREAYPPGPHGTTLPFRRVFVVAGR